MNTIVHATSNIGPLTRVVMRTLQVSSHGQADNDCETRGLSYTLELQEIAPGLVVIPELACSNCGLQLQAELVIE
jgi:hypothetical protein